MRGSTPLQSIVELVFRGALGRENLSPILLLYRQEGSLGLDGGLLRGMQGWGLNQRLVMGHQSSLTC